MPELRKSSGAFDLPSIITGVVVVGILAAGVLAAIFGVIPFAQDRGAKQDLSSIRTAEGVAKAKDNRFMDHAGLLDTGYLQPSSTEKTTVKADTKGTCYVGLAKSGTGKIFYSTDARTDPEVLEADTDTGCLTPEELAELIEEVGGIEDGTPEGAPKKLKLTAVSALEAKATWNPVKGATGYKIEYQANNGAWTTRLESTTETTVSIYAQPKDTVTVRVYTLKGEGMSEPSTATVRLPDSAFTNPGFESGLLGWTKVSAVLTNTTYKHAGGMSADIQFSSHAVEQVVTVPVESPVLTFWTRNAVPKVLVNNVDVATAVTAPAAENGFTQRSADLSAYAGKTVTVRFAGSSSEVSYLDDVAFQGPMAPTAPRSVTALSKSGTATVSWVRPVFTGGGIPVTSYTATAWTGGSQAASVKVDGDQLTAVFTGLEAGANYTLRVRATNQVGTSPDSTTFGPVALNTGAFANPGFENDLLGWTISNTYLSTSNKHAGSRSAALNNFAYWVEQVVTVPAETPVLTFWAQQNRNPKVQVNNVDVATAVTAPAAENGFTQRSADLSAYAGKTVTVRFTGSTGVGETYLDDVTFK
ncbi:fibronectin type III domain-containing protein [Arthrobacter sp. zg-Y1110]|uniref:fibronectin type III domain-containing protein n=1 Tax=Arthrobacter sp. zg-Y1110 TaxID=2886932 RepID=UPI0021B066FC|nr:fibronectin type III domain-containing protein [Arthrobacter sp. zg-Y1110]UWX87012.1 fibronectin type III domain-containing protein [Arthrobacter sp. zg-Y1110]